MPPPPKAAAATTTTAKKASTGSKGAKKKPLPLTKTVKPARPVEEQLQRHFTSLCAQIEGGHFKNAVKTCDRILRLAPNDEDTLQTKLFLLLQTDQYASALEMLESSSSTKPLSSPFDKAYILYRLHREHDAREVLGDVASSSSPDRGTQHLDAQLKFRNGEYHAAHEVYNELLDSCPPDTEEYSDILVNLEAAQTHIDFLDKGFLTGVHALPTNQSASALESLPAPSIVSALSPITNISTAGASTSKKTAEDSHTGTATTTKAPAPRKSRVPKHVVPGVTPPPDPERWLKKRERTVTSSRYDARRRKAAGGGPTGLGTQGAAISDAPPSSGAKAGGGGSTTGGAQQGKKGKKK